MAWASTRMMGLGISLYLAVAGCGGGSGGQSSTTAPAATSTVNLVVTDAPSTKLTVLSFQVQITGAVLQPGSISLLPRPVTVDLAQLVSDTGLLASTVVGSTTYTSLEMTFANPQVTVLNNTGTTLTLSGQSCAAGATCTYVPVLNNASLTISSGVFPLTLTASSATGINLDLSIPDLLQTDLSITLASGKSVNVSLLPGRTAAAQQATIDDVVGTITTVSGTQVTMTTALGDTLVLDEGSTTTYLYPESVCASMNSACPAVGQVVTADLQLLGSGQLGIASVAYLGGSGAPFAKGLVLSVNTSTATPTAQVLVQRAVNAAALDVGEIATVSLPSGTQYLIGTSNYPAVGSATFASATDLVAGQELLLGVGADLVTGTAPTFSASSVYLEPSQVIGTVLAVNASSSSVSIDGLSGLFAQTTPAIGLMDVQAGSTTTYLGLSPAALSALTVGQFIVAKGPLFGTASSGYPSVAALAIGARTLGN